MIRFYNRRKNQKPHSQKIIWYRDGHLFDYYCPWAFHVYGPLWNQWYGYEKEPFMAMKIEQHSNELMNTYTHMFDRDGHVTMWGRSGTYRSAPSAPMSANFLLNNPTADPGWSRRITSGAVLQFVQREECFYEGVPCLGFYGPFQPFVQTYSCTASPFWMTNAWVYQLFDFVKTITLTNACQFYIMNNSKNCTLINTFLYGCLKRSWAHAVCCFFIVKIFRMKILHEDVS